MRGKVTRAFRKSFYVGITPAYAGKRATCRDVRAVPRDHPRLCGEKPHTILADRLSVGSPPPMRGKGLDRNEE